MSLRPLAGIVSLASILSAFSGTARAGQPDRSTPVDLTAIPLEDLMNLEVTSVSMKEQRMANVTSAVTVIDQETIRRSGATHVAELLRLVPGVNVARVNQSNWAISARGFNAIYSNKLLVLIDGRTVYNHFFAGTHWDVQDLPLQDIDHIEVIRGPGATVWGANAVNGVINIITKTVQSEDGGSVGGGLGIAERATGEARWIGPVGTASRARFYGRFVDRGGDGGSTSAQDRWALGHGGFRIDWQRPAGEELTLSGDAYYGKMDQLEHVVALVPPFVSDFTGHGRSRGAHLLGSWTRPLGDRAEVTFQGFVTREELSGLRLDEKIETFDQAIRHHVRLGERHDLVSGVGYRLLSTHARNSLTVAFEPETEVESFYSAFAQDEITVVPNRFELVLGSKAERSPDASGVQFLPSVRGLWTPSERHTVWAAVSRAIRSSSRADDDLIVNFAAFPGNGDTMVVMGLRGREGFRPERLTAWELGYRAALRSNLSIDATTFLQRYRDLRTLEPDVPQFVNGDQPYWWITHHFDNGMHGDAVGAEAALTWNPASRWKLTGSASYLELHLHRDPQSRDPGAEAAAGDAPRYQMALLSMWNPVPSLECDAAIYHVDDLPNQKSPEYTRCDLRIGWRGPSGFGIAGTAQNVLDDRHLEFDGSNENMPSSVIPRSLQVQLTRRF